MPTEPNGIKSCRPTVLGNRFVLLGLFAVFLAPILVAYALNVWRPDWRPFGEINHGELIEPARKVEFAMMDPIIADRVADRWILLHVIRSRCESHCEALLDLTQRAHISLGKDHDRVVRMLVYHADTPIARVQAIDAGLIVVSAPMSWFGRFAGEDPIQLLILDPQRYAVLRYRMDVQGSGFMRDLARVLKISKIG